MRRTLPSISCKGEYLFLAYMADHDVLSAVSNRYGAAYKRAQRTPVHHIIALMAFKSAMPEAAVDQLSAYIQLR